MSASPIPRKHLPALLGRAWQANTVLAWCLHLHLFRFRAGGGVPGDAHFVFLYLTHWAGIHGLVALLLFAVLWVRPRRGVLLGIVAPLWAVVHFVASLDAGLYALYRLHFDATVLSFLTTPGLRDNLHLSAGFYFWRGVVLVALVGVEVWGTRWLERTVTCGSHRAAWRVRGWVYACLVLIAVEKTLYMAGDIHGWRPVLVNVRTLPFYRPITAKRLARRLGIPVQPPTPVAGGLALRYPHGFPEASTATQRWNVLWIAVEGMRFDVLRPEITPRLCRFAERAICARRHYSTGNATRCAIFGLFYGLQPTYWHAFLAHRQGPVFIRTLQELGYEIRAMGSSSFTNPELRHTCFADLPDEHLLHSLTGPVPDRDVRLRRAFTEFLDCRDLSRPFFVFLFFDSPHSYRFKSLEGLRLPHPVEDVSTVDYLRLARDEAERRRAHQRYENSQAFVDVLLGDLLDELDARGLSDETIVLIAGDHGEEFGETGRCGHNNAFNDWQTRTVFMLRFPGVVPQTLECLTSHVDAVPTTLGLLGITTPPERYCQGRDLRENLVRSCVPAASWSEAALITETGERIVFPLGGYRPPVVEVYDSRYQPVRNRTAVLQQYEAAVREVIEASQTFSR